MEKKNVDEYYSVAGMLNIMVSEPYYLFHFLTFFSYIPIRFSASHVLSPDFTSHLLHREIQGLLAFSILAVVKMVKEETWEAFIADTLFYAEVESSLCLIFVMPRSISVMTSCFLLTYISIFFSWPMIGQKIFCIDLFGYSNFTTVNLHVNTFFFFFDLRSSFFQVFLVVIALVVDYHLAIWYMLALLVIYIFTQQPPYLSLGTSSQLTPLQLETIQTEGRTSKFWLVEFRALSSSNCIRTSRIFPQLSITFSNKNLSFGTVDIGLFPNTAQKFGISLGNSKQLPTYILFENAEDVARFPESNLKTKASIPVVTKKLLCRHFELDKLLLDYVNGK